MGRGTRTTAHAYESSLRGSSASAALRPPLGQRGSMALSEIHAAGKDPKHNGRIIDLKQDLNGHSNDLALDGSFPGELAEVLVGIKSVEAHDDGLVVVEFANGRRALVDASGENGGSVTFADSEPVTAVEAKAALGMGLAHLHADEMDDVTLANLADAYEVYSREGGLYDARAAADLTNAIDRALMQRQGEASINPAEGRAWAMSQQEQQEQIEAVSGLSPAAMARRQARELRRVMTQAHLEGLTQNEALLRVAYGTAEGGGAPFAPSQAMRDLYNQTAVELGGELCEADFEYIDPKDGQEKVRKITSNTLVPKMDGWISGDQEQRMMMIMGSHAAIGTRTFFLAGPPGTGKTMMAKKWAEMHGMPFHEFTLGEGSSIQAMIGDTGVTTEYVHNKDGDVIGAVPKTEERVGKFLRVAKHPGVSVLNEADMEEMGLAFNTAYNDRVGATDSRTINTNTAEGKQVNHLVHPDHFIFVTWNPGREDIAPPDSSMDRGLTLHMQRGTPQQEAPKYASMIETALRFQNKLPGLRDFSFKQETNSQTHVTRVPEAEVFAKLASNLQNLSMERPAEWRREVGPRLVAKYAAVVAIEAASNRKENAIELANQMFRGYLPASPRMKDDEAADIVRAAIQPYHAELLAYASRMQDLNKKWKQKRAAEAAAARKAKGA